MRQVRVYSMLLTFLIPVLCKDIFIFHADLCGWVLMWERINCGEWCPAASLDGSLWPDGAPAGIQECNCAQMCYSLRLKLPSLLQPPFG